MDKNKNIIEQLDDFRTKLQSNCEVALALMEIGVIERDKAGEQKALMGRALAIAIKYILDGKTADEAIAEMLEKTEVE